MRVAVTGGTGFLGAAVIHELVARGHDVLLIHRPESRFDRLADVRDRVRCIEHSAANTHRLAEVMGPVDAVASLAATYARDGESPAEIHDVNVARPLRLLDAAIQAGASIFVNAGTALPPTVSAYAASKHEFVRQAADRIAGTDRAFVNARIEMMYGVGDDEWKLVMRLLVAAITDAVDVPLTAGEQRRDLIHVDDAAAAVCVLLERSSTFPPGVVTDVEVGSGVPVSVRELAEQIRSMTGSGVQYAFGALRYRENEVMHSAADISALTALGWAPRRRLEESLEEIAASLRQRFASPVRQ
jgi:CDP-paratose synthetase